MIYDFIDYFARLSTYPTHTDSTSLYGPSRLLSTYYSLLNKYKLCPAHS